MIEKIGVDHKDLLLFFYFSNRYYKTDKNKTSYQKYLKRKKRTIMSEKRKRLNLNDFMNKKYGCLTIIGIAKANTDVRNSIVRVRCECGKESDKLLCNVLKSQSACSKLCDLYGVERTKKTVEDKYINKKYGHLTIRSYVGRVAVSSSRYGNSRILNRPIVRCECDCGRMVDIRLYFVTHGDIMTCGKCSLSLVRHGITAGQDPVMMALNSRHSYIAKYARTSSEFQVSKEWFNDDDPIPAIHNFINYCKPLYEKVMNDGNPKNIFIHRIDIDKL